MHEYGIKLSCSGIDVVLSLLSPSDRSAGRQYWFQSGVKSTWFISRWPVAWDDSVSSTVGLPWTCLNVYCKNLNCHILHTQIVSYLVLFFYLIDFTCVSWEQLWEMTHMYVSVIKHGKETLSLCFHIPQYVISSSLASISSLCQTWLSCIYYLRINISNPVTFWKAVYLISSVENKEL